MKTALRLIFHWRQQNYGGAYLAAFPGHPEVTVLEADMGEHQAGGRGGGASGEPGPGPPLLRCRSTEQAGDGRDIDEAGAPDLPA